MRLGGRKDGTLHSSPEGEREKRGFTLAEVLITLGIIGIVAAMTMPTLIQKHKKQAVISKLQKASSIIAQAHNMATAELGEYRDDFAPNDADAALEIFNKYYKPYLRTSKVEKGVKGVFAYLTDGTALYFFRTYRNPNSEIVWHNTYFIFCMTHKACETLPEGDDERTKALGRERFTLYTSGQIPRYQFMGLERDALITMCKNGTSTIACTSIIGGDSWQIKDDYPIKL